MPSFDFFADLKLLSDALAIISAAHARGFKIPSLQAVIVAAPALIEEVRIQNWAKLEADLLSLVVSAESAPAA